MSSPFFPSEEVRREAYPVLNQQLFLAHAGVTILPRRVAEAMSVYIERSCLQHQEFGEVLRDIAETRKLSAELIGANADEIALLGPTSLGLSLFANGIDWEKDDEVVYYDGDYPSNVYPWTNLKNRGVRLVALRPERPGEITPELVESALTSRTRLVALASCHFLSGYRIEVDTIGRMLRDRGVLFSLDAIQTLGAFPTPVQHVDFLSADAHKWLLGPMAIGIVYVSRRHFGTCRPTLLGSWNVRSPNFIAQPRIEFENTAQRYEPGVLNAVGVYGMREALRLLAEAGAEKIASHLLDLHTFLWGKLEAMDFISISPHDSQHASGILTVAHPRADAALLFRKLEEKKITASLRHDKHGKAWLRFSPHYYNTTEDLERVVEVLREALS